MPSIRIYRARIDIGDGISGLVFSYDPIREVDSQLGDQPLKISQVERFYIKTPPGFDLADVDGRKFVRDIQAGENVYMRAARVVSRVWQNDSGFDVIPSTEYASLERDETT